MHFYTLAKHSSVKNKKYAGFKIAEKIVNSLHICNSIFC